MNRRFEKRLEHLETANDRAANRRVFRVIAGSELAAEKQIEALKRDQGATDDDLFIMRIITGVPRAGDDGATI